MLNPSEQNPESSRELADLNARPANTISWRPLLLLFWLLTLGFFFANAEIQIEGSAGWAGNLPTWRVTNNPLLNIFWGGKPLTGYHLWIFTFMALVFHAPLIVFGTWSVKLECRVLGSIMVFWIIEDFLWFVLNPAFGLARFRPEFVPWHKHWVLIVPVDYVVTLLAGGLLIRYSFRNSRQEKTP